MLGFLPLPPVEHTKLNCSTVLVTGVLYLNKHGANVCAVNRRKSCYFPSKISWDLNKGNFALAIPTPVCSNRGIQQKI